ncbi:hypothetical protein Tco_1497663, partial [Tanacetum coccineum]
HSNSEEESWTFSDGDDDDEDDDANKDSDDDDDAIESDDDEEQEDDDEDEEEISDQLVCTPSDYQIFDESQKQKDDDRVKDGKEDKEGDMTNVNLEGGDVDITEADTTKDTEDAHVTLTAATPVVQQQSSSMSNLVSKFISPTTDEGDDVSLLESVQDERQWHPLTSPTPDREWHLTKTVSNLPPQHWITNLAQVAGTQSFFDKFMATPIDFSAFMINRLKIDHLIQELLTGPTYDLIKGTCKSVAELEYHLEEVFKATN